ncbi:MAG: hypothetical protein UT33_C0007G0022 [Candidatus Peregrinibacteria bacterium GW2011_GWC2_39_14]|nr:MAG: hypothetical protein US92_C0002G0023 [Candidatus Peregrinibacteria bacterium GW2011_GWA2_38_36]KKR06834.1 MAG: hypothetical protein UT33_C0007G0022 [Candidatus Peregrinibacteria bacterium GW2011_GWC2_39_14]
MKNKKRVYLKIGLAAAAIVLLVTAVAITLFSGGGGMFKGLSVTSQATFKSGDHVALSYNGKFCSVNKDNKIQCNDSAQHDFVLFRYGDVENYKPFTAGTKILLTYKADKNDRGSYCGKGLTVDFGVCDKKLGKDSIYENYSYIYTFAGSTLSLNGKSVNLIPYGSKVGAGATTSGQTTSNSNSGTTAVTGSTSGNSNSGSTTAVAADDKAREMAKSILKIAEKAIDAALDKVKAVELKLNGVKINGAESTNAINNKKKEVAKVEAAATTVNKAAGVINNNKSKVSDVTDASKKANSAADDATTAANSAEKNVDYALDHNVVPVVVPANFDVVQNNDTIAIRSSWNLYCSSGDDSTHEITCSSKTVGDEQQFVIEREKGTGDLMGGADYFSIKSKKYDTYCKPAPRTQDNINSKNNITCDEASPWDKWLFTKKDPNNKPIKNTSVVYLIPENTYKCYIKKDSDGTVQCDNESSFSRAAFTVVKTFDYKNKQKTDFVSKQAPIIASLFQDSNYKGWEYALVRDGAMNSEIADSVSSMKLAKGYKARVYSIANPDVDYTKPAMTVLSNVPRFSLGDEISSLIINEGKADKLNNCIAVLYRDTKYSKNPITLGSSANPNKSYENLGDIGWNDSFSSILINEQNVGKSDSCYVDASLDVGFFYGDQVTLTGNNYDLHMNDAVKYIKFDKSEFGKGKL